MHFVLISVLRVWDYYVFFVRSFRSGAGGGFEIQIKFIICLLNNLNSWQLFARSILHVNSQTPSW